MAEIKIIKAETEEDLDIFQDMTTYAFAPSPVLERDTSRREYQKSSNRYLLYEGENPVSSLDSIPMTENVRGKIFKMQGIAGVSSYPEGRRKGYIKKLMDHAFQEAKEEGNVFSTLYPFRESFYGRFGYIKFPQARKAKFSPNHLKDVNNFKITGDIERYKISDCLDRFYQFLTKVQAQQHGMALFNRETEQRHEKSKFWVVFVVVDGEDRGMMVFSTGGFEKEMKVVNFFYLDSNAKYLLLHYISLHKDQFSEVELRIFAHQRPETWLYDTRMNVESRDWVPSGMGRVLDISGIGGMQVGEGEVAVKVVDEQAPWNSKNWRLWSSGGILQIEESSEYKTEMTIQGISALVYGGYDYDDMVLRGWITPDASKDRILNLFPSEIPVLFSIF